MLVQYWCDFATWSLEIIETRYASVPARTTRFNQRNPLKLSYRCSLFFVKSYSISDHSLHSVVKRDTSDMIVQRLGKRRSKYRCIRTIFPNQKKIPFNLLFLIFTFFSFFLSIYFYLFIIVGRQFYYYWVLMSRRSPYEYRHTHICKFRWLEMREFSHKNFTQEVSVVPRDNRVISRKKET